MKNMEEKESRQEVLKRVKALISKGCMSEIDQISEKASNFEESKSLEVKGIQVLGPTNAMPANSEIGSNVQLMPDNISLPASQS